MTTMTMLDGCKIIKNWTGVTMRRHATSDCYVGTFWKAGWSVSEGKDTDWCDEDNVRSTMATLEEGGLVCVKVVDNAKKQVWAIGNKGRV